MLIIPDYITNARARATLVIPPQAYEANPGLSVNYRNQGAFTLVEFVTVLALVAVWACVLSPVLARTRVNSKAFTCMNNMKRLTAAWMVYAGDNDDKLVRVGGLNAQVTSPNDVRAQPGGAYSQWCQGRVDQLPMATNTALIQIGLLYPYVNNLGVYKCPADRVRVSGFPTCRSLSMNCWMNPIDSWNNSGGHPGKVKEFWKQTDIVNPGPAMAWVLIDENPWSINDGFFVCDPAVLCWIDYPATYHNGAGGLSFADGHAEIKKWKDPKILGLSSPPHMGSPDPTAGDLDWLQQRSSSVIQ